MTVFSHAIRLRTYKRVVHRLLGRPSDQEMLLRLELQQAQAQVQAQAQAQAHREAERYSELLNIAQTLVEMNAELGLAISSTDQRLRELAASCGQLSQGAGGAAALPAGAPLAPQEQAKPTEPAAQPRHRAAEPEHGSMLNLGNIANVAYNSSKLQQAAGWDADLLCFDFYHLMSCPEWEDAEFAQPPANEYYPDWWEIPLPSYRRPSWFIQGSAEATIEYQIARKLKHSQLDKFARRVEVDRWRTCSTASPAKFLKDMVAARPELAPPPLRAAAEDEGIVAKILSAEEVAEDFRRCFPDDERQVTYLDYCAFSLHLKRWAHLFELYDVVTGYAVDPILPYLAGKRPYAALEIGTVRDLPFADNATGKMLALAYRHAELVFVTNSDILPQLDRLGIPEHKRVYLPHPYNHEKIERFRKELTLSALSAPTEAPFRFVHPSRQHWHEGIPSMLKGNHLVFAAARILKDKGYRFTVTLIDWGQDVERSRQRIAELGVEDCFRWMPPMRKQQLWHECIQSNAVIDQFVLPALGNVGLEALCLGRPLISRIDSAACTKFFGQRPPVLHAENEYDLANHMELVMTDVQAAADIGAASRAWFERYHSAERILSLMQQGYARVFKSQCKEVA